MTDDFNDDLDDIFNTAKAAPKPVLTAVEEVVQELNSGFGNTMSGVSPYKDVQTVQLDHVIFDAVTGAVSAKIKISSAQQSTYGDNYDTERQFVVTHDDARQLAATGPHSFRAQLKGIAQSLDDELTKHAAEIAVLREKQRVQGIADTVKQMANLTAPVTAPPRARFSNRK